MRPILHTPLDQDWLAAFRSGEEHAFDSLFQSYASILTLLAFQRVGQQELARLIVNDGFVELWNHRKDFHEILFIEEFLCDFVQARCSRQSGEPGRLISTESKNSFNKERRKDPPGNFVTAFEVARHLFQFVDNLSSKERAILVCYYQDGPGLHFEEGYHEGKPRDGDLIYHASRFLRKTIIPG